MIKENIVDIQIINNRLIEIKEVSFDIKAIEDNISKIKYKGQGLIKDKFVENAQLPSIAKVFYESIFMRKILTPETLFKEYLFKNFINTDNDTYKLKGTEKTYSGQGIKARVYRAFPSLLRDFHFYVLCFNSKIFENIKYSFITDTQDGIDIMVTYKGENFGISLFVDTARSMQFKKKKYKRHDYSCLKEICIGINPFDKSTYMGDFALYNKTHIEYLINEIEKQLSDNVVNL
ncbi:MAG: hypothetical protein K0R54_514 [Clostridiaceae bacterium]|jgi:hypothetical protein|nr:hypothetical protein [Clostridiaceae bacterium]